MEIKKQNKSQKIAKKIVNISQNLVKPGIPKLNCRKSKKQLP